MEHRLTAEETRVLAMSRFVVYAWKCLGDGRLISLCATLCELTKAVEALDKGE